MGYMASGKSTIGSLLASKLNFDFVDFDNYIVEREGRSIDGIFSNKGELYFRKKENMYLKEVVNSFDNTVISLGGGTPCYGDNLNTILSNQNIISVYLKASVKTLSNRLIDQKDSRPVVKHLNTFDEVREFVGKHLFERQFYYNQAKITIDTENKSEGKIVQSIVATLF